MWFNSCFDLFQFGYGYVVVLIGWWVVDEFFVLGL